MKKAARFLAALAIAGAGAASPASAQSTAAPLNAAAATVFANFLLYTPHRAFVVDAEGKANFWAGAGGADPAGAVANAMKRCEEHGKPPCTLHVVNNYTVTHQDWRKLVPARDPAAPDIGRLRPEPYWAMRGPQLATGLVAWSHGYMSGKDATNSAPQPYLGRFTRLGYDLYRFDREWISDWASDATALAAAVSQARQMGYRRVVLAGQSAGAWVSLAAALRGAPADGVISISAAHHGPVEKMTDPARALGLAESGVWPQARPAFRRREFRRGRLRCRRTDDGSPQGLRRERRPGRHHRRSVRLQGPWRGRRFPVHAQVRLLHRKIHRERHPTGAMQLGRSKLESQS